MAYFEAKMHQIRYRLGRLGSLQRSQTLLPDFRGLHLRDGMGRGKGRGRTGRVQERRGECPTNLKSFPAIALLCIYVQRERARIGDVFICV